MDGNTGNVYPKHKQRNNSDSKIQTNWKKSKKSKKSVNQFKKNYLRHQTAWKQTKKTKK